MLQEDKTQEKFAIRFGLGALKAVGFGVMEVAVKEREVNGKFKDIYDFAERLDPRSINKKSIEALAKAGAFDTLKKDRRQIAESFEILSSYAAKKSEEATSNQMSLFGGLPEANAKPELKKVEDWTKVERLQKEFEAFGYFLNEHPLDDNLSELRKRGVIFSDKLERDELEDGNLVKMAGVVAASKHRSGPRGRFAYMTISDPFGIFEAMIFDEALITSARDILADGSVISLECLVKKDEGGVRILIREVKKLEEFLATTKAQDKDFEDIKKQPARNYNRNNSSNNNYSGNSNGAANFVRRPAPESVSANKEVEAAPAKKPLSKVDIIIKTRDPIFGVKSFLSQCLAPTDAQKFSTVIFSIAGDKKITKVELSQKYLLDETDVSRLRRIEKIIDVESVL
jgi:DNA polymerase III alpha subunit